MFLAACDDSVARTERIHPTEANRLSQGQKQVLDDTIPAGMAREALTQWQATKAAILGAHLTLTLGGAENGPELLGIVSDVVIGHDRRIAILDGSVQEVLVFDSSGQYSGRFGGIGDGPQELRRATSIEGLRDGSLLVSMRGRIKVFESLDESWQLRTTINLPLLAVSNSCLTNYGVLFLASLHPSEEQTIRRMVVEEETASRFGRGYQAPNPAVRLHLSRGVVGCLPDQAGVIFGFELLPTVQRYAHDGTLLWSTGLASHAVLRITENVATSVVGFDESEPYDVLSSIHSVPSGRFFILQFARVSQDDVAGQIRTYLVDVENGVGALLGSEIPRIVAVDTSGYVTVDGLLPHVKVWRVEWPEGNGE